MATTQPLSPHIPIVDAQGRPTQEFLNAWQAQRQFNSGAASIQNASAMSGYLDQISDLANSVLVRGTVQWGATQSDGNTSKFLNGGATPQFAQPKDTDIALQDETTTNATLGRHGYLKKLNNDPTMFMRGDGVWAVPAGGGGGGGVSTLVTKDLSVGGPYTTVDFTGYNLDTYDWVELTFDGITPNITARGYIRVSTDDGATWVSTNTYKIWVYNYTAQAFSLTSNCFTAYPNAPNNNARYGTLRLSGTNTTGQLTYGGMVGCSSFVASIGGLLNVGAKVNAIQYLDTSTSATWAVGTITLRAGKY